MQAIVLEGLHQPMKLKQVPTPTLAGPEALVQVHAAALNHRDLWIQQGQYAGIKYPAILGSDGAGVVTDIGTNVDPSWVGKEVIINPSHHWGDNPKAQGKAFKILGLPEAGTFAQYVKVPAQYLTEKPAHLSFGEAAALPLAGLTAYRSLFTRAGLVAGENVLITGVGGGAALFALQFALAFGATGYVTSGSEAKIKRAKELGAAGGVLYTQLDWVKQLQTLSGGFDVIVDSAAGEGFGGLVDLARPGGRIVFFGGTKGTITSLTPQKIFWKQLSILGSTMGTEQDFSDMMAFVNQHQLKPVVDQIFPWQHVEQALQRMENTEQFGKIVLRIAE